MESTDFGIISFCHITNVDAFKKHYLNNFLIVTLPIYLQSLRPINTKSKVGFMFHSTARVVYWDRPSALSLVGFDPQKQCISE